MSDQYTTRLGPGIYRVSTIQDPISDATYNVYTQSTGIDTSFYLTFVGTNTTTPSKSKVYTSIGLSFNPNKNTISYGTTSLFIKNSSSNQNVVGFGSSNATFFNSVVINKDLTVLGNLDLPNISAKNISGGNAGDLVYQYASGITTFLPSGQIDYVLTSNGPNLPPSWKVSTGGGGGGGTYVPNAGVSTYSLTSGISTYSIIAGFSTYATLAGISTYSTTAGVATYSNVAGVSTYSNIAGISTYSNVAGVSTYSLNSGISTYATTAGIATYSNIAGISSAIYAQVKNTSGSEIQAGTPLKIDGPIGISTIIQVIPADASNISLLPASFISNERIAVNAIGRAIIAGESQGYDTSSLNPGAPLYVRSGGGIFTTTRPSTNAQQVATVGRVHSSEGSINVFPWPVLGNASTLNVGITSNTLAAGDDSRFSELNNRLNAFRDAANFYASKKSSASNSNNGTSDGEPFLTIGAAVDAANAYVTANPNSYAKINIGPGTFVETGLPFRVKPNILIQGALQRGTVIKPASGEELNGFFALDSGCMVADLRFAGHQAVGTSPTDSSVGQRAWAIRFNDQANSGQGVYLTASPYIKDCASITAEDDDGLAGSTSTGDTGGGIEVDGSKCRSDSPVRSMVVYGFTQQNLGGPGCVVKNDAYVELVSFFGLFGTWHVQAEKGGQATLSGGGCSEFGTYGLVADGYSTTSLFTGVTRIAASSGDTTVDVISMTSNRLGSSSRPASGQIMFLGGVAYVVQSGTPINSSGVIVPDSDPTRAGYRVAFFNPTGLGLAANVSLGSTADFRQRSQISAGCHSANYVGSGTNYSALPWNGGVPIRANEAVERNLGRVFGLIVNDVGDVKIAGGAFSVDGTTGAVTINTNQFNLSGLNAIGPFSRNGGVSNVGVQLQEVSNEVTLLASTGSSDGNTAPTQFAVRTYVDNRFLVGLTTSAGQPIIISDTSSQDPNGFWTRSRNISLSMNAPNGLLRLNSSGTISSTQMPTTDSITEGTTNLYYTQTRARQAIGVGGSLSYNSTTGIISYSPPILALVATTGAYNDLTGRPTLGTASTTNSSDYATAAQGTDQRIPINGSVTDEKIVSIGLSASSINWSGITTWTPSTSYTKGSLVSYLGVGYRRSVAGTSGTTFNSSNWNQFTPNEPPAHTQSITTINDVTTIGQGIATATSQVVARNIIGAGTTDLLLSNTAPLGLATTALAGISTTAAKADHQHQRDTSIAIMPLSGSATDPTGSSTTVVNRWVPTIGGTFLSVALDCETAISGAAFIVNITLNGTTIFSTKPQINVGGTVTGNTPVLSITTFAAGDVIRAFIDQASGGGRLANITFTIRRS